MQRFVCQEPDCQYATRSEVVFVKHLTDTHAVRPEQVQRLVSKSVCPCVPGSKYVNRDCNAKQHIG